MVTSQRARRRCCAASAPALQPLDSPTTRTACPTPSLLSPFASYTPLDLPHNTHSLDIAPIILITPITFF